MTLTINMPLLNPIETTLGLSHQQGHLGIAIVFFTFSLSAIVLSIASDLWGIKNILSIAQLISISGLLLLSQSKDITSLYIGLGAIGLGTGCYSSLARALILSHHPRKDKLPHHFSKLSIAMILGPSISTPLAYLALKQSWQLGYLLMAGIESLLFIACVAILSQPKQRLTVNESFIILKRLLNDNNYLLYVLIIGISYAIFMQSIMSNINFILRAELQNKAYLISIYIISLSISYLIGILCFQKLKAYVEYWLTRAILLIGLVIGALLTLQQTLILLLVGLYLIAFSIGFIIPMSTTSAMKHVSQGQGMASAWIVFCYAMISSLYSQIEANFLFSHQHFMSGSIFVSILLLIGLFAYLQYKPN